MMSKESLPEVAWKDALAEPERTMGRFLSMHELLDRFQRSRRSVVIQVNGKMLKEDRITPEGRWRCRAVAHAIACGEVPHDSKVIIIPSGWKGKLGTRAEGEVFREQILSEMSEQGESWPDEEIIAETEATNTTENALKCSKITQKLVEEERIDAPYRVYIASTGWHYDRQALTHHIVPEKSEFVIWQKAFPGVEVVPIRAPYLPWFSRRPETRWLARVHVATHFFTPIQANLYAIMDTVRLGKAAQGKDVEPDRKATVAACQFGDVKEIREEALALCDGALGQLRALKGVLFETRELLSQVEDTRAGLEAELDKLGGSVEKLRALSKRTFSAADQNGDTLPGLTRELSGQIGRIRYSSDPDRG